MVALVVTVWNEGASIDSFLDSIVEQTTRPVEVQVVDGGSTDETLSILSKYSKKYSWITVIERPGVNIAEGRNIGINLAATEIVAVTDAGCRLEPDWLEKITKPFDDASVTVVGGFYRPEVSSLFQRVAMALTLPIYKPLVQFLPSSRSFAFRKEAWREAGGYPEWLYTAEDTAFVLRLKELGHAIYAATDAVVTWKPRTGWGLWRQYRNYSRGDGHAKLFVGLYGAKWLIYLSGFCLLAVGCLWNATWLAIVGMLILMVYVSRYMIRSYKIIGSAVGVFLTPVVILFLDSASLTGFVLGLYEGKPKPRAATGGGSL